LAKLCRSGYSERLLLSQDVGHKHYLREYGGWGYGHRLPLEWNDQRKTLGFA
jgi:phosphotriesterase-related protein